ncbi:MAG: hypothetical protein KatS3mg053_1200 [Candidatus Roseilinea sp.]|nr:MAG: hypothetical protein KatS3mg053_1200 [Candidatus Roseilinea sp.]
MRRVIEAHPLLLTDAARPVFDAVAEQYKDDEQVQALIQFKRNLLRACREHGVKATFAALEEAAQAAPKIAAFEAAVERYTRLRQAMEDSENDVAACRRAAQAGEALFGDEWKDVPGVDWDALREDLASVYNMLGNALYEAGDKPAALIAFERAIAIQSSFAMWHRNRAGALIELGRLDEAEAAIARARELEPDAPRLTELDAQLAAARAQVGNPRE